MSLATKDSTQSRVVVQNEDARIEQKHISLQSLQTFLLSNRKTIVYGNGRCFVMCTLWMSDWRSNNNELNNVECCWKWDLAWPRCAALWIVNSKVLTVCSH